MKKKLSVLLMSSVIAVACAGCQSDTAADSSDKTSSAAESSVSVSENSTVSSNTEVSAENSISVSDDIEIENNISVADDENFDEIENTETGVDNTFFECAYNSIDISDEKMRLSSIDLSSPAIYTVTTADELKQFYNKNKDTYCLDEVDSGVTFSEATDLCDDMYFEEYDMIIIIQKYNKEDDIDLGDVYVEDSELKINILKTEPSLSDASFNCSLVRVAKQDRGDAKPVVVVAPPMEITSEINYDEVIVESASPDDTSE